jgi:hypothetical protein
MASVLRRRGMMRVPRGVLDGNPIENMGIEFTPCAGHDPCALRRGMGARGIARPWTEGRCAKDAGGMIILCGCNFQGNGLVYQTRQT